MFAHLLDPPCSCSLFLAPALLVSLLAMFAHLSTFAPAPVCRANQIIPANFSSSKNPFPPVKIQFSGQDASLGVEMLFLKSKCFKNSTGFEMPRSICGIAAALLQNLHLIGAVNTEFKVEHRILPGIPILCAGQRNLVLAFE